MKLEDAIAADREGRIQEAAAGYEEVLRQDPDNMTALINLLALYWRSTEIGFSSANWVSTEFFDLAATRMAEMLDSASASVQGSPVLKFWASYIGWTDFGGPIEPEAFRTLLRENPEYLEPAMALFMWSDGREAKAEALRLLQHCREVPTIRCQYVASIIDAVLSQSSHT